MTDEPKVDPLYKNIGRISSPSRFFSPTVTSCDGNDFSVRAVERVSVILIS